MPCAPSYVLVCCQVSFQPRSTLPEKNCLLTEVVKERRASKPDQAKIAYHEMEDRPLPEDPAFFVLKRIQNLVFKASNMNVKTEPGTRTQVVQGHAAGLLPAAKWQAMPLASVCWLVDWTPLQGLKPKRPLIVAAHDFVVPAGAAIELKSS